MAMKWTDEQQKVIDLRNRNILVSAAAGSGKTAVLVERIISMVLDEKNPIDIDRLLIVTFTKAAAAEMRERIGAALEARLLEDPDNQHLQRQTTLLHHAQISTIHGFCSFVIRNYFHRIDLDPGFRMADEGELKLLKADVLKDLLEEAYAEKTGEYLSFVESYATGKTDEGINDLILKLYEYASSAPWPDEWLDECKNIYKVNSWEELENSDWMKYLWSDIQYILCEALEQQRESLMIAQEPNGPYMYLSTLKEDGAGLDYLRQAKDYRELYERIRVISWSRLSVKKDENVDPLLRETVKESRNRIKELIKDLKEQYFYASPEEILETVKACGIPVSMLIDLTKRFSLAFARKKREKNLLDFSDLEHLALNILVDKTETSIEPWYKMNSEDEENENSKLEYVDLNANTHVEENHNLGIPGRKATELTAGKQVNYEITDAARELSERFHEILIDEYQDSNMVQELLLNAVSAAVRGKKNVFMVGDVKQSIYRFRLARPELFMEKLDTYSIEDSQTQRIDLHKNFRSRPEVLRSVNFFFQQIMRRELGGVEYDRDAALYTGAAFEAGNRPDFATTEVLALELDQDELLEEDERKAVNARELEARMIGKRIREIVGHELVWDKKKQTYRPAKYSDCVVLLRTMAGWSDVFAQTLNGMGIPAYSTSKTGYFSAQEVQTVLNFLRICDNPMQEIPYTAVLTSAFVGCTPEDLAKIKCVSPEEPIYRCVSIYVEQEEGKSGNHREGQIEERSANQSEGKGEEQSGNQSQGQDEERSANQSQGQDEEQSGNQSQGQEENQSENQSEGQGGKWGENRNEGNEEQSEDQVLKEKLRKFLNLYRDVCDRVTYTPIHELIWYLTWVSGYADYVAALPYGEQRIANVRMLVEKAIDYEATSYGGLFHFIRYMEYLQKYEVDFGEVNIVGENDDTVRIMSIHKSKGLEFPIVFVAGLSKRFNQQDLNGPVLMDADFGVGSIFVDFEKRVKKPTLIRSVMRKKLLKENLGEELRVLYVAMTRAKEKLILTGTIDNMEKKQISLEYLKRRKEARLPYSVLVNANCYWSWILPALARVEGRAPIVPVNFTVGDLVEDEARVVSERVLRREELLYWDTGREYDTEVAKLIKERFTYEYPYGDQDDIPVKVSVSELKKHSMVDEEAYEPYHEPDVVPLIPQFMQEEVQELEGASRGTAYHALMEHLDLSACENTLQAAAQAKHALEHHHLSEAEWECIRPEDFVRFAVSDIGKRMAAAQKQGRLYREQPFVLGISAQNMKARWSADETILVQGIIDAYFYEEDDIILVDYKTDKIGPGGAYELVKKYKVQLENYAEALERLTHKKVKEKIIYSFTLGEEISVGSFSNI